MSIILIADPCVLSIPIVECGEGMIDVKILEGLRFGPPPETPESEPFYTQMRETVYQKLCQAQEDLPEGIYFKIYEAWRSLSLQEFLFANRYRKNKADYPSLSHEDLFQKTTELVSPVVNLDGTHNVPPHTTGAAVDIFLIDKDGHPLDMGMDIYQWDKEDATLNRTHTYSQNISSHAQANRQILIDTLSKHGFVNYPTEWWHWSYGDRYWAYFKGEAHAIYGSL